MKLRAGFTSDERRENTGGTMTTSNVRRVAHSLRMRAFAMAVTVAVVGATPVWAGKTTCLTGTDPAVSFDRGRIASRAT